MAKIKMTNSERVMLYAARKNGEVTIERYCKTIKEGRQYLGDVLVELGKKARISFKEKGKRTKEGNFDILFFTADKWTVYAAYFPHDPNNKKSIDE